jgi:hypothetical protein
VLGLLGLVGLAAGALALVIFLARLEDQHQTSAAAPAPAADPPPSPPASKSDRPAAPPRTELPAPSLPDLVRSLRSTEPSTRLQALAELRKLEEKARPALPDLLDALLTGDETFRSQALLLIRAFGPIDRDQVKRVEAILRLPAFREGRAFALDALAEMGPGARPALPAVLDALANGDADLRRKALGVLAVLGPLPREQASGPLLAALRDEDGEVSRAAADALDRLGPPEGVDRAKLPAFYPEFAATPCACWRRSRSPAAATS